MTTRSSRALGPITVASAIGIGAPGYIQHGIAAISPFLIAEFAMSKSGYGLLVAAFSAVGALMSPVLGAASDRIGGRRMLTWAFVAAVAVAVLIATAPATPFLFIGALVGGCLAAAVNPATNTLIGSDVPPDRRGMVVGIKQAGGPAGIALGGAILPGLALAAGWRTAYATGVVLPLIGLAIIFFGVPGSEGAAAAAPAMGGWASAFGPVIRRLTANGLLVGIGLGGVLGFVALYGVEELSMSETLAGAQLTIIGGLGFFGRLGWGALADRASGWRGLAVVLSAVSVVGSVAAWVAPNVGPWLLIVASIVIGSSAMAWNSIGMLAIVREQSLERAGTASGIVLLGFLTGFTIGPWAFGALVDATGAYTSSWFMVTVAFVLSALVLVSRRGLR